MAIQTNFPAIKPTLLLDFANTEQLDPRITFTRASTATYYGTQTAKAEENLLLQSQDFTTTWALTGSTVSANSVAAPDGTTTADTFAENTNTSGHISSQVFPIISGLTYSASVFGKNVDGRYMFVTIRGAGSNYVYALFDLLNGVVTTSSATGTGYSVTSTAIQDVGNGWYRCSVIGVVGTTVSSPLMYVGLSDTSAPTASGFPSYTGTSKSIYLWGAQLEQRSAVTAYTPTTTQTITNYIPRLLTAASGVARFDHNPITFESLGLEIEEQRTNLLTYSEMFTDATWTKGLSSVTANTIVAPDGTLSGDKLVEDTSNGSHLIRQSVTGLSSGSTLTLSIYLKAAERTTAQIYFNDNASTANRVQADFNLSAGTTSSATNFGTFTGATSSITSVGNGWYRCTLSGVATGVTAVGNRLIIGTTSYTGDGYSGIFIWGAQLEAGAFATSYIPTVASQVTRAADAASMTGTNFSSWYNAGQGTLYSEASVYDVSSGRNCFVINDGTAANRILTGHGANPKGFIATGNTTQMNQNITAVTFSANTFSKISLAYADNNGNAAANGTIGTLDTAMTIPVATQLQIGAQVNNAAVSLSGTIKKLAYYPIRVTDTQLQALTS